MSERAFRFAFGTTASGVRRFAPAAVLAALAALPICAVAADVHKCVENGRTTYQDAPCGGAGTVIRTDDEAVDSRRAAAAADSVAKLRANVTQMEQARVARERAGQIDSVEREIDGYRKAEQAELAALRSQRDYVTNNFAGAAWERNAVIDRLARDMQAVSDKYALKTQAARERLAQLRAGGEPPKAASDATKGAR
jgi:uncharacterized protein DUF4124